MPSNATASDEDDNAAVKLETAALAGELGATSSRALDHGHADARKTGRQYKLLVACLFLFTCLFSWSVYTSYIRVDPWEATKCRMAYMSPGYIRLEGLNASHSRLAGKYSLWLYREQGWDLSSKPHGVPVLFSPGNAGSYRQVRSLAAAAARQYYSSPGVPQETLLAGHHQELDFFAADFNEDFSAFHAGTLKEQAEYLADCVKYILTLYEEQGSNAPEAVNVLAHSMGGIAARYMFLQDHFKPGSVKTLVTLSTPHIVPPATFDRGVERIYSKINAYWRESYEHGASSSQLNETLLISIAGGIADTMVSSDYTDLSSILPPSNGFSVITTSIPTLYSPVDHLAMMWCDQLRQQIISALLQSTDSRRRDKARSLKERLAVFQDHLFTGLELLPTTGKTITAGLPSEINVKDAARALVLGLDDAVDNEYYSLHPVLSSTADVTATQLQVLVTGSNVRIDYFGCAAPHSTAHCGQLENPRYAHIPVEATDPTAMLAKTSTTSVYADIKMPKDMPYATLKISRGAGAAVYAHLGIGIQEVPVSLLGMYLFGWQYGSESPPASMAGASFRFPHLDSSLIVYGLEVATKGVVRVSTGATFESHFFAGPVKRATVHLHSGAPYLPASDGSNSLHLQVWHEPTCQVSIRLTVDRKASLGTIVTRYRSIIASWPMFFLLGTLRHMLLDPHTSTRGAQPASFERSMRHFLVLDMRLWLAATFAVGIAQVLLLHLDIFPHHVASVLLGTRHVLLLALAPTFLAVVATLVILSHVLLKSVTYATAKASHFLRMSSEHREERSRTRMIGFISLTLFVMLFAPHQFAMLSLFMIHFMTTVRVFAQKSGGAREVDYGVLLLMLWLLPSNGAILIVWLRNLQAGWWWPFPSDHNILAIVGPILLVEHLRSGKCLTLPKNRFIIQATDYLFIISMLIVLLWTGRYVFVVGEIVNVLFIWLAVLQYQKIRQIM